MSVSTDTFTSSFFYLRENRHNQTDCMHFAWRLAHAGSLYETAWLKFTQVTSHPSIVMQQNAREFPLFSVSRCHRNLYANRNLRRASNRRVSQNEILIKTNVSANICNMTMYCSLSVLLLENPQDVYKFSDVTCNEFAFCVCTKIHICDCTWRN